MYSFNSEGSGYNLSFEPVNPESQLSHASKLFQQRQELTSESSNEIQTPNFNDFPGSMPSENLFDTYHHHFSEKNNQLSKLISTFEGLGLDVEYLEESDEQCAESSEEQLPPRLQTSLVLLPHEELDQACPMISTVSRLPSPKVSNRRRHHLDSIRLNCKAVRTQLAAFLQSLYSFQKQIKNIFASAHGYFTTFLTKYYQACEASFTSSAKCLHTEGDWNYLQNDNAQLYKIVGKKEQRIKSLLKEKDELLAENEKLHNELEKFGVKHRNCHDLAEENQELQKLLTKSQTKNRSLQLEVNDMTQKMDQLKWKFKDLQQQNQIANHEHRSLKEAMEKKYEKMFNQTVEEITRKIEAEAYYRLKHDYPLKDSYYSPIESQKKMAESNLHRNSLQVPGKSEPRLRTYQSYAPTYQKQLPMKRINSDTRQSTSYYKEDSCRSSRLSTSIIEQEERKVDRILQDIKMMKNSRQPAAIYSSCRNLQPIRRMSQYFK